MAKRGRPGGEASSRKAIVEQRRAEALELRTAGLSFRAIGARLGVSHAQAAKDINAVLDELRKRQYSSAERIHTQSVLAVERMMALLNSRMQLNRRARAEIEGDKDAPPSSENTPEVSASSKRELNWLAQDDLSIIDRLSRLLDQRARLFGLFDNVPLAPVNIDASTNTHVAVQLVSTGVKPAGEEDTPAPWEQPEKQRFTGDQLPLRIVGGDEKQEAV